MPVLVGVEPVAKLVDVEQLAEEVVEWGALRLQEEGLVPEQPELCRESPRSGNDQIRESRDAHRVSQPGPEGIFAELLVRCKEHLADELGRVAKYWTSTWGGCHVRSRMC